MAVDDGTIRNVGQSRPALTISQEPGAAAQGNPALGLAQADGTGPALLIRSAGSAIDMRDNSGVSRLSISGSGNIAVAGVSLLNLDLLTQPLSSVLGATMSQGRATTAQGTLTSGTLY